MRITQIFFVPKLTVLLAIIPCQIVFDANIKMLKLSLSGGD
jgi:hypothetical protein